ncbi:MAG: hypothetical protein Q4D77_07865 [Peptostreptococcaceae bacterium]|nr:hypothetical protein [Peptostreptococcaceae bacterium]
MFGKSAKGIIIGFGSPVRGTKGMSAYPYLVKFDYNDQSYIAKSLKSASGSSNAVFLERNLDRKVTVFFKPQDPKIVTIAVFKEIYSQFGDALAGIACDKFLNDPLYLA